MLNNHSKNYFFVIAFLFITVSAASSIIVVAFRFNEVRHLEESFLRDAISRRLENSFAAINNFPGSAGRDLSFLHNLSSVQNLHNSKDKIISPEVYSDFKNVLNNNSAYKDLFFYRKEFDCAMRVSGNDKHDRKSCESPPPVIADILKRVDPLDIGQIYISPIMSYNDFSLEKEEIPVIVYVAPANIDCHIVSVIDASYFLEEIRRMSREGEQVFLLDKDGAYLANTDRAKEKFVGWQSPPSQNAVARRSNFYKDFPDAPKEVLSDVSVRWAETQSNQFAFWRIYPTESNFAIYEGTNKIMGEDYRKEYFWVMAAVSDKVENDSWWKSQSYAVVISIILISHMLVAAGIYLLNLKLKNQ